MITNLPASNISDDPASRLRVAERVAAILTERINSGAYGIGELLPTERTLASELRIHRRSVRTAIDQLVEQGLVSRRPNCRPTVARPPAGPAPIERRVSAPKEYDRTPTPRKTPSSRISTSNLIALIMWHGGGPLEHAGTSQQRIFWGMNQSLMKLGYHAVFLDLGDRIGSEEENAVREAKHLRYVRDQGFGGALFYPYAYNSNRELVEEVSRVVPLVLLDRRIAGSEVDFVGIENRAALSEVTEHLIALGHRRIVHVTRHEPIRPVQDRIQGYVEAMRRHASKELTEMIVHVAPGREILLQAAPGVYDRAWAVFDAVFRLPEGQRPTAAACVTDYMAVNIAERLSYLGLTAPGDVAITGFDNIVPTLPNGAGLTTVAQPYEEIGTTAVDLLMRRIADRKAPTQSVELTPRLIVRESSSSAS